MSLHDDVTVRLTIDGNPSVMNVQPRESLADALRRTQELRSIRLGCEHGACGACTVRVEGRTARSCLILAVQADQLAVQTLQDCLAQSPHFRLVVEELTKLNPFQCGFCATGILVTVAELLEYNASPGEDEIRDSISAHICRCTGYQSIVEGLVGAIATANGSKE